MKKGRRLLANQYPSAIRKGVVQAEATSHFSTGECLSISMRKNGQWRETLLVLSSSLPYNALAVYMHPPQHLAETRIK
jgi:hypothetical protein